MKKINTKRALFTSVMSMLLCVTMLVGSTFAWFTDNATTSVNTIVSGTLDVALVDGDGKSLEGTTLGFVKGGTNTLWEPGSSWTLQDVYVKNNGNLALKFKITITGIKGNAELNNVIDWSIQLGDVTLALENGVSQEFHLGAGETSGKLNIIGKMQETAGNEYQGKKIEGISILVQATQDTVEHDSTNNQYDAGAQYEAPSVPVEDFYMDAEGIWHVSNAAGLKEFRDSVNSGSRTSYVGKTIKLDATIDLAGEEWTPINAWDGVLNNVTIDGNGNSIKNMKVSSGDSAGFINSNASSLTIQNLTFENAYVKTTDGSTKYAGVVIGKNYSAVTMENVNVKNSQVRCTWQCGGLVGFAEGNAPNFVNCSVSDTFIGGGNCTAGVFFGLGAVDVSLTNCSANNVDVYTDMGTADVSLFAGYLYGKTLTTTGCTATNLNIVSSYPD